MGRFLFLLPYFMFFLLSHFPYSHTLSLCNHDDQSALLHFKNSFVINTSYINWFPCSSFPSKTESWKNGTDCCEWDGVKCDAISGHVIGLDLSCSHLQGEFHPNSTIFKLRHLQQLNLAFNDFSGSSLYPRIGDLLNLTHLNLSSSLIGGDVPSTISHLSKLVSLDLSIDSYMILDPSTWKKLILNATNLRELHLDGINMSSITERSFSLLTNLSSSLVSLHLSETELQGNLPRDILCLPKLEELDLSFNYLKGQLPKSNWSTHLRYLDLSGTSFSGEIPNSIGHLKYLNHLGFRGCNFDGMVPISLGNLTQLMYLSLGFNINLNGEISSSLFNLTQLWLLDLSENELVGPIPSKITNLSKLKYLYLSYNMLNGTIPNWCYSLPSLSNLDLSFNQLTGSVNEFSSYSLKGLNLSHNGISGTIPQSLSDLRNLEWLDLSWNQLTGEIPMALTNLNFLSVLNLSQNQLEGIIPKGRQFDTFGNDSYEGNPMLCGLPLSKSCNKDEGQPPHSTFHHEEESGFGWKSVAVGYACGAVFGMLMGCNVFLTGKPQWLARLVERLFNIRLKRTSNRARANRRGMN